MGPVSRHSYRSTAPWLPPGRRLPKPCTWYLLGRGGWPGQSHLWRLLLSGRVRLAEPEESPIERMAELMERYSDHPMDLADASLVALAETRALRHVFTLDRDDFHSYRLHGRQSFQLIP